MAKQKKIIEKTPRWDPEFRILVFLAACLSIFSFLFYFQQNQIALYGDAVAHLNIARRVFDSKTPGLLQLGTVWLPLPHVLMIPFLVSDQLWRTAIGGSIPSLLAYILGVLGIYRLLRGILSPQEQPSTSARFAAWIAALVYAANPNLIYMQTTAMGESLYLAFFIWAIVYFSESTRDPRSLVKCGLCLAAACLTRYDGWFLAIAMCAIVFFQTVIAAIKPGLPAIPRATAARFILIAAAAPALWLAYNAIIYRNPLEFENGPYSAKAIERRTQSSQNPGHPGSGNPVVAGLYFLKSAQFNVAQPVWLQRSWILLLLVAAGTLAIPSRFLKTPNTQICRLIPLLLLLVPLAFYALSIAYGGVPIFVPSWYPFSHYNVRYGLQMLPAFAAAIGLIAYSSAEIKFFPPWSRVTLIAALTLFLFTSYATVWKAGPVCLREAELNMRTRNQLEAQLAIWLQKLPPDSTLLMYVGDHVGALQHAGIPLRHVINEGNHRVWKQPTDPDGLWERALADPAKYADYVVATAGDPVSQALLQKHLESLVVLHVSGQAPVTIYRTR